MKYKLYTDIKYDSMTEQILKGRGINDVQAWINADMNDVSPWSALDNISLAVNTLKLAIEHNQKAIIVVDCDTDGFCSSAILINYLYSLYPDWVMNNLKYVQHDGKEHGINDLRNKLDGYDLIICPDSASNDYEEHQYWNTKNVDIVILDHHLTPCYSSSDNTITVNNQLSDAYYNKELSAAGVVWQFCRAYDEINNVNGKKDLDLVALGNLSDMMSFKSIETKAIIMEGLNHIQNAFFSEMINLNEYTLNKYGGLGYKAIAFAVTPFINATVRSGTTEEKDLIFRAMCDCYNQELVNNTKRGYKGTQWPLYQQAAYLTQAIKRRQTKLETESMLLLENKIEEQHLLDNAIIVCCCEPGEVEPEIRGLVANKIANKYQRPCLVLTRSKTKDDNEYYYRGSGRNYSMSEIQDLKAVEESTAVIEYVQGRLTMALIHLFRLSAE